MTTKEKVLSLLLNNTDYISGEEIGTSLGISRNAIWKAVNDLKASGYDISSVRNKGYKLISNNDILSAQEILSNLNDYAKNIDIKIYQNLESTNQTAKEMAVLGANHGTVILADSQTGGRAHNGESFTSPMGGIYLSIILLPDQLPIKEPTHISALSAVSVCKAIEKLTDIVPSIRLITDVFDKDKKISGIMTESAFDLETNTLQWIVLGIGIPEIASGMRNIFVAELINILLNPALSDEETVNYYRTHHEK